MRNKAANRGKAILKRLANVFLLCLCGFFLRSSACGLERDRTVAQFYHTGWTVKDGVPGQITSLAQTTDGYIWLGTGIGLYRFDGIRFERFEPTSPGKVLLCHNIQSLYAPVTGGLWVGCLYGGASFLKNNQITNYSEQEGFPPGTVGGFAIDRDGTVWAATYHGLARFDGTGWQKIGADWNYPADTARTVFFDRDGTLWTATGETLVYLLPGKKSFEETGLKLGWVTRIAEGPDGKLWLPDVFGTVQTYSKSGNDLIRGKLEIELESAGLLFDREGSLWVASLGDGIRRVAFSENLKDEKITKLDPATEIFTQKNGLTADYVWPVLEDREGNVWFGTSGGLDCFRPSRLVPAEFPAGTHDFALARGENGSVWSGSTNRPLMLLKNGIAESTSVAAQITCAYRDDDNLIWLGGTTGIWRIRGDQIVKIAALPKNAKVQVQAITKDASGTLWVSAIGLPLLKLTNGVWSEFDGLAKLPETGKLTTALTDSSGRVWLGYTLNKIAVIDRENILIYSSESGLNIGNVTALHRGPERIWIGGELGLAFFDGKGFQTVATADGKSFNGVSGIIETAGGGVWLQGIFGIFHIPPAEIQKVVENPLYRVETESFDFLDGLSGNATQLRPFPSMIEGSDGRLWFATSSGVVWLDPARFSRNSLPPPVSIQAMIADGRRYNPDEELKLPVLTSHVEIDYTALSLSVPERVRFRYKLEGADQEWQDAGTRRQAFYNNLSPGNYRFLVIACNNDNVWNETGATLQFVIAPAFYQTKWFLLVCLAAIGCFVWMSYRWRIYLVKHRLNLQFEERLSERTRIAQELHDTLLQGVFSASIQLDAATEQVAGNSPLKSKLARVQQLMEIVLTEGRNTIRGLHSPGSDNPPVLEKAFAEIKKDLDYGEQIEFRVIVIGESRPIHPIVRTEIYRLGREALVNAFRHSKAKTIEVEIDYASNYFKLVVRDDGVGINPEFLRSGREGHLGIVGMRECSDRIGGKLKIGSWGLAGTQVELSVPHQLAFKNQSFNWISRWLSKLSRSPGTKLKGDKPPRERGRDKR